MKILRIILLLSAILGVLAFLAMPEKNCEKLVAPLPKAVVAIGKGTIDVEGGIVHVAASRQGIVNEVFVEEGQRVQKGQLLARLDVRQPLLNLGVLDAELNQMQAELEQLRLKFSQAQRELKRVQTLALHNAVARQQLDTAQDTCDNLKLGIKVQSAIIKKVVREREVQAYEVSRYDIRAPVAGVVVRRLANPGQGTSTLDVTDLFLLLPNKDQIVRVEVEERFIAMIKTGMSVTVSPEDGSNDMVEGRVLRIGRIMGTRKDSLLSPQDKVDVRVVEIIVSLSPGKASLIYGQRVIVKFADNG